METLENQFNQKSSSEEEDKNPFKKCFDGALAHLARKDYSRYKLKKKLKEKGYPKDIIDGVLDVLIEKNYLREDLYKEARIKGLLRKGHSFNAISYKMSQEMCPATSEEISIVAEEIGLSSSGQLWDLIEKKVRIDYPFVPNKKKLRERTLRYVVTRGHSISEASQFYDQIIKEYEES